MNRNQVIFSLRNGIRQVIDSIRRGEVKNEYLVYESPSERVYFIKESDQFQVRGYVPKSNEETVKGSYYSIETLITVLESN